MHAPRPISQQGKATLLKIMLPSTKSTTMFYSMQGRENVFRKNDWLEKRN